MAIDPHSATWIAIKEWAETRRAQHLQDLRGGSDDDDKHRGALDELDLLLQLENPPEQPLVARRAFTPDRL